MDLRGTEFEVERLYKAYLTCKGYRTDSRNIEGGEMFFAFRGEKFDANAFALPALERGAAVCVIDNEHIYENGCSQGFADRLIMVDDTLEAFRAMAAWHRSRFDIPVIGVTGTNGKTTTKELLREVLSSRWKVVCTKGNLNNHIGVPMTLLTIDKATEIAIIEMGANHPGEIRASVELARPTCGVITNVGKAHLEGFGSFEGVKKTKGELYDWLDGNGGVAFYNADSPDIAQMAGSRQNMKKVPYGVDYSQMKISAPSEENPYLVVETCGSGVCTTIETHLIGNYNAMNIAAALAVGEYFGVDMAAAAKAIGAYVPSNSRSQLVRTGRNSVILDAYNANVSSMMAALDNFSTLPAMSKVLILGDMLELGKYSVEAHRSVLERARQITPEIYLVGQEGFCKVAREGDFVFENVEELIQMLKASPMENKTVLIKGSNGIHLGQLVEYL
ncbi:MAG: UDP-N-acetylmuramoyl-tripeptide--D-alanyl-D-alanine ligase [Bacteroidales bacterium]|nr:UDP-N-acetylmuramoyl-tripeptide--D-alanyl-D-alanine ligase [Bacteroidales bacterium]